MFLSKQQQRRRQGNNALDRFNYLQKLVTEFQDSPDEAVRTQVLANLCNFAYDPINYENLRALNVVPDLLLDMLTEENVTFIKFALGGICNSCNDPVNGKLFIENDAIELLCNCLDYDNDTTILENTLLSLVYLLQDFHTEAELAYFNEEIIKKIGKFTSTQTNVSVTNLASILRGLIFDLKGNLELDQKNPP